MRTATNLYSSSTLMYKNYSTRTITIMISILIYLGLSNYTTRFPIMKQVQYNLFKRDFVST